MFYVNNYWMDRIVGKSQVLRSCSIYSKQLWIEFGY